MSAQNDPFRGTRILIIAASLVVIIIGIKQAHSLLMSFLVASFLAVIAIQPMRWLERKRVPSVAAALIVVAGLGAVLAVIGYLVGASVHSFSENLPVYQARLREHVVSIQSYLLARHISITDPFLFDHINPGVVMNITADMITKVGSALCEIAMILLILTFMLLEASSFPEKLRSILHKPHADCPLFTRFAHEINRYLVIKTQVSLAAGALIGIWLSILGVDYPVLWGFLAFLLHYIPNVGALIAAVPAVLFTVIQLGAGHAALAAAGYVFVFFILGNVVEPRLMGKKLGLSTLVVILSLIFWEHLLGLIGLVLAIPFTMALKFACEVSPSTHWLAVLLGPEIPPPDEMSATETQSDAAPVPSPLTETSLD